MMAVTPDTLSRHELVGLEVSVTAASNPDLLEVAGDVVTETTKTLGIEEAGRVYHVPKDAATFAFELPSGDTVTVDGDRLVERPPRRTKHTGDSKWR
jgi:ribonuclease P protein subunit POP4